MPKFSDRSLKILETCHPDIQKVLNKVIEYWDCRPTESKRTEAQQKIYVATGASKTLDSKHVYPLEGPSLAIDVYPYPINFKDTQRAYAFAGFVIGTAISMGIKLRWGGDWDSDRDFTDQNFHDLPHFELIS